MNKGRLEAFSDGVIAVIITILVLEMKPPQASNLKALTPVVPVFLCYVLSFVYVGIYWNNHHHLLHATEHISGGILWANLHLLFWLSLIPFATTWMGTNDLAAVPVATYGLVLLMAGIAYYVLTRLLIVHHGKGSVLAEAIGRDFKGVVSVVVYVVAIPICFVHSWIACACYVAVALMWLYPDRRIERSLGRAEASRGKGQRP